MTARTQPHYPNPLQPRIDEMAEYARTYPAGEIAPWHKIDVSDLADELMVEDDGRALEALIRLGLDPQVSDAELAARFRRLIYAPLERKARDEQAKEDEDERDAEMDYLDREAA